MKILEQREVRRERDMKTEKEGKGTKRWEERQGSRVGGKERRRGNHRYARSKVFDYRNISIVEE